jgi:hypothetical protein
MWNGELGSIHELAHIISDVVGGALLLVAGRMLSRHSAWKTDVEKRFRKLEDWRIRFTEWRHRLEDWQIRLEHWQIRLEEWQRTVRPGGKGGG